MFASVFSELPARLRRALTLIKAFAFLEHPPAALLAHPSDADASPVAAVNAAQISPACTGDRRRGPGAVRTPRPGTTAERCGSPTAGMGRGGRPAAPSQRCATPTTSGKPAGPPAQINDRRASVPGGFLHP